MKARAQIRVQVCIEPLNQHAKWFLMVAPRKQIALKMKSFRNTSPTFGGPLKESAVEGAGPARFLLHFAVRPKGVEVMEW